MILSRTGQMLATDYSLILDWYSNEFKLKLWQMFPRKLKTHPDGLKSSLDKIGLVSDEIFDYSQTRTNVGWTNVNVTNVPKTVDKSCRWHNHPSINVWLSFDQ